MPRLTRAAAAFCAVFIGAAIWTVLGHASQQASSTPSSTHTMSGAEVTPSVANSAVSTAPAAAFPSESKPKGTQVVTLTTITSPPAVPAPVQVLVQPATSAAGAVGPRDFLVPLGTLVGAALGFFGAITAARRAAESQDRRSRTEAQERLFAEDRERKRARLDEFAVLLSDAMRQLFVVSRLHSEEWRSTKGDSDRTILAGLATQVLGSSRLLPLESAPTTMDSFVTGLLTAASASSPLAGSEAARAVAGAYDELLKAIADAEKELMAPAPVS